MDKVDTYVSLAKRPNTHRSYASAVKHFEVEGRGALPASSEAVATYLAQFAESLAINTLRARLAGLSRWHKDHGFVDPTKSPLVSQVLKGIRTAHNVPEKQARPIEFELVARVSDWLRQECQDLAPSDPRYLRAARDQAILLIGFWRGFRSDELTRLKFEHISVSPGVGMQCYLAYSKGDREAAGRAFFCPALPKLCPVTAFEQWRQASGQTVGPVFRKIDQWGHVSARGMAAGSIIPWLRNLFTSSGVQDAQTYSSHSLRRGFANWANSSGWDIKELMTYVGWTDINSAMRYLELSDADLSQRFQTAFDREQASKRTATDHANSEKGANPKPRAQPVSNVVALPKRPSK